MTALLRVASVVLGVAAVALFWLAFTQFDDGAPPSPGSPAFDDYERGMMRDAQLSVVLGLAGCFVLLGAFACHSRATAGTSGSRPPDPEP
jgi:hypothetical protein